MPDFSAAARRHLDDGDLLYEQSRFPNAVQLWAYGAECTLKALACKQNLFKVDAKGKPPRSFTLHLNQIKDGADLLSLYNAAQTALLRCRVQQALLWGGIFMPATKTAPSYCRT